MLSGQIRDQAHFADLLTAHKNHTTQSCFMLKYFYCSIRDTSHLEEFRPVHSVKSGYLGEVAEMKRSCKLLSICILLILFHSTLSTTGPPGPAAIAADPTYPATTMTESASDNTTLVSSVLSAAGAPASSRNFRGNGSLGQSTPIGVSQHPGRVLSAGFWYGWWRLFDPSGISAPPELINLLMQNHPNPFNPQTTIRFVVAEEGPVALEIFDLRGLRLRVLIQELRSAGNHEVYWDGMDGAGRSVPSGTYFYRLKVGDFCTTNKMLLLK